MRKLDLDTINDGNLHLSYEYEAVEHFIECAAGEKISVRFNMISNFENIVDQTARQLKARGVQNLESIHCPYFGILRPSARMLADVLVNLALARATPPRVLELGCGLALPSLALSQLGCAVVALDHHPDVQILLSNTCKLNATSHPGPEFIQADWQSLQHAETLQGRHFDWLVASDILYEKQMAITAAVALTSVARRCLVPGGEIWVTDPGRTHLQEFVHNMERAGFFSDTEVRDELFLLRFTLPKSVAEPCRIPAPLLN